MISNYDRLILCLRLGTRRARWRGWSTSRLLATGKRLGERRVLGGTVVWDGSLRGSELAGLHVLGLRLRRLRLLLLLLLLLLVMLVMLVVVLVMALMGLLLRLLAGLLGWRGRRGRLLLGRLRLAGPVPLSRFGRGVRLLGRLLRVELLRLLGREIRLGFWRIGLLLWSLVGRIRRRRRLLWLLRRLDSRRLRFRGLHIVIGGA